MAFANATRIVANAGWLLGSDVVNRGAILVIYAMVARYLGPVPFGQLAIALALFYTFQIVAGGGLKSLITRQVAPYRLSAGSHFLNGSIVALAWSFVATGLLVVFVTLMDYSPETASTILLVGLGLIPSALVSVSEATIQGLEEMHYITIASILVNVVKVALCLVMLVSGYGLTGVLLCLSFSYVVVLAIEWCLILRQLSWRDLVVDPKLCSNLGKASLTFCGIDGMIGVLASSELIILSKLAGAHEVGIYAAAMQCLVPVVLLYQSVSVSMYPMMCRAARAGMAKLQSVCRHWTELLLALGVPVVVSLFFLADSAVELLYGGKDFGFAGAAIRIMVWGLLLRAVTSVYGQALLAGQREGVNLRIVAIDVGVSLLCGLILISQFGLGGAAVSAVVTRSVDFVQHCLAVNRQLFKIRLGRIAWRPLVAGTCMAVVLAHGGAESGLAIILAAGVVYSAAWLVLVGWFAGGPRQLKSRCLYLLRE
jgi:O-antigen/teichoic acid export membrane protein